jgi:putative membrane protein
MKLVATAFSCCFLLSLPALPQHKEAAAHGKQAAPMTDQEFVDFAAQTDMMEAHLGQLAANQAESQGVKDYAQMLVTDHTNDYNQLTAVAGKANLNVPKGLDAKHDKMIAPFEKLKGAAFDRQFIHEMVTGHEAAIAAYDRESRDGQNADLKSYAQQALPVLEKHKNAATDLQKSSRGGGGAHKKTS